jgi:cyclophilin family peptidyl-prolyl cis-trans isomerase
MKKHMILGVVILGLFLATWQLLRTRPREYAGVSTSHSQENEGVDLSKAAGEMPAQGESAEHDHEHEGEASHEGEINVQEKPGSVITDEAGIPLPTATGKRTRVRLDTSMGPIEVILYDDLAPKTAKNFLDLTNKGFYKNMIFHRVVRGFVIQTGDPTGTGSGGPGYKFDNEISPSLSHNRLGVLAMANSGPNTNGSQFYITMRKAPHLDRGYSVFGQVVKGMDTVRKIDAVPVGPGDRPITPVEFREVVVLGQE